MYAFKYVCTAPDRRVKTEKINSVQYMMKTKFGRCFVIDVK